MADLYIINSSKSLGPPGPAMIACMDGILDQDTMTLAELRAARDWMREKGHTEEEGTSADTFIKKAEAYYKVNGMDGETVLSIDHYPVNNQGTEILVITGSYYLGNPGDTLYTALDCEGHGNTVCLEEAREEHAELHGEYDEESGQMAAAFMDRLVAYYKAYGHDSGDSMAISIY